MDRQQSSRLPKASKRRSQRSPSPNEEVIQRRLKGKRLRTGLRKTEGGDSVSSTDERKNRDIIDIINSTHDAEGVSTEDQVKSVEVTDEGVDESDDDCDSSSIASGPSLLRNASPKKPRPSQRLCSACHSLYQKAKKMKAPIKNKLLDNDPKSLTCDHWVLMKKNWRPRRLSTARGKLLIHIQLVKKRLQVKNGAKRPAQYVGEGGESVCERPHTFLQRNLRRVRELVKKERRKKRRKRTRDGSQGPRVAKQQRLLSDDHSRHISISSTDDSGLHTTSGHSGSPVFEGCSDQEVDDQADTNQTVEMNQVTLNTTGPRQVPPKQKPNKTSGFRDLLAQLRGNSSMIVRETR